jgi:hypothetical protein
MSRFVVLFACFFACDFLPAQISYPRTEYPSFGASGGDFATSRPIGPEGCDNRRNYKSMSPDTWAEPGFDAPVSADDSSEVPRDGRPFQPASFGRGGQGDKNQVDLLSSDYPMSLPPSVPDNLGQASNRYPLYESSPSGFDDSIIRMPSSQESVLDSMSQLPLAETSSASRVMPDYGFRDEVATQRNWSNFDTDQKFDFENKNKESPGLREVFATGRWFGSARLLYLTPAFKGNTAINTSVTGVSTPFDFDYEAAPHFQFGFESKHGPGFEFTNYQYDESSNAAEFTSDGIDVGTTSVWVPGRAQPSRLSTSGADETLTSIHSLDVESFSLKMFKELKFPVSRLNGKFGLEYASVTHVLDSRLNDAASAEIGSLVSRSDMQAWGPQFSFEYFRPIGHTKIEFMTRFGGSILFGRRDQLIQNSQTGDLSRVGADEFITGSDFFLGAQYRSFMGERRALFFRTGLTFQSWSNGGTAIQPQDDFALRGFSASFGYNR